MMPMMRSVLVETDSVDIPGGLVLASPEPGRAAATASRSLSASLEHLEPVLRTVRKTSGECAGAFHSGVRREVGR